MNYSKNEKTYGRKIIRRNKRKQFVGNAILFLIGISIGCLMISGIIHIFCCRCVTKVEATEITPVAESYEEVVMGCEEPETISLGEYKLTAYCACMKCCGKTDGITASGVKAKEGVTIAADKSLPFGTKILINGHEYTVQDRGGAIKGNKIDVFFDSHQAALEFGVQYKEIYMVKGDENYDKM